MGVVESKVIGSLCVTAEQPDIKEVLFSPEAIQKRVAELGERISADYKGRNLLVVGVLKGSVIFLADLLRALKTPVNLDFVGVSSYAGTRSTGVVQFTLDLRSSPEGRDVLLVEDIVDTGLTLSYLRENLLTRKPRSLEICAFLDKPECRKAQVPVKYVGFGIPNKFVIGYGLDYNELYRNLPYVGVLRQG